MHRRLPTATLALRARGGLGQRDEGSEPLSSSLRRSSHGRVPGSPTDPTETHGPEGTTGEAGESGTRYDPGDEARELRGGVKLLMRFEQGSGRFSGTAMNTTNQTVRDVRVEIHLSNGVELGPTPRVDLSAGETRPVERDARGQTFDWWTVHVELGSGAS